MQPGPSECLDQIQTRIWNRTSTRTILLVDLYLAFFVDFLLSGTKKSQLRLCVSGEIYLVNFHPAALPKASYT